MFSVWMFAVWMYTVAALCCTTLLFTHSPAHICFILEVNPIFECTCATARRHPRGENCKITSLSRRDSVRARWTQQETAREAGEIKPFLSQMWVFLDCFYLLELGQACLSLIITQVLFSARCVFCLHWEGPVNRSGGLETGKQRQGVPRCINRSIFSLPSPRLNGQLGPLRAFLAEEWPEEGDDRKSENTSAALELIHLPLLQNTLGDLSLDSGNFQTASSPPGSHSPEPSKPSSSVSRPALPPGGDTA